MLLIVGFVVVGFYGLSDIEPAPIEEVPTSGDDSWIQKVREIFTEKEIQWLLNCITFPSFQSVAWASRYFS